MAEVEDIEQITLQQEVESNRIAQEALRGLERTEIERIHTGVRHKEEPSQAENTTTTRVHKEQAPAKKSWWAKVEVVLTGDILLAEEATRIYNFLMLLGVIFLASIFSMFGAFQQDLECGKLRAEVALMKERAIRASEARTKSTSHSAILNELKSRGIELEDPKSTPIILK